MPILIASYAITSASSDTTSLVTPTFTPSPREVIVIKALTEDSGKPMGTPSGGGLAYTSRAVDTTASHVWAALYTAVALGATAGMAVTFTDGATAQFHSMVVERWGNAVLDPAGPALCDTRGTGAPTATVTTTADNSIVSWVNGDWAAVDGTTRTYQSAATEEQYTRPGSGINYTGYYAYQQAGVSGAQTVGLTAPGGQTFTTLGVEVQHKSTPIIVSQAVMRAATW